MVRRVAIRLISLLLMANGIAGIVAVWLGWSMTSDLLATWREMSRTVAVQQTQLVQSVRNVAVAVDDSAQATTGVSRSTAQARASILEATQTSDDLAATFDRLAEGSRATVFGVRPLEGMTQPFITNAEDFRRLSGSLSQMSTSLDDNSREMARVGDDLRSINAQLHGAAASLEALPSASLIEQGLGSLELGTRLFLALILFEAILSALTGLALVMTTVQPRVLPSPEERRSPTPDPSPVSGGGE